MSGGRLDAFPPRKRHLLLAGGCIAAVYLVGVTGQWWPTPDSALYLGLGRSLAEGDGYRFNGSAHNFVTPGLPLILAGLRIISGEGFWAPNLFMALCGLTSLLLVYLVVARLSGPRMALAVALATALSYTYFFNSHRILTDAPFAALFWAILYACIRYRSGSARWLIPAGLLSAAAVAVRMPGILFLVSLAIAIVPDRPAGASIKKRLAPACVILAVIATLAGGFFIAARSAAEGMPIYAKSILANANVGLTVHLRNLGLGIMQLPRTVSEMLTSQETYFIGLPALLLIIVGAVSLWRRGQKFVLLLILLSVLVLAFCGRDKAVRPRYLMPLQPLLLLALMEGLCWSIRRFYRPAGEKLLLKAVGVLVGAIIACNAPKLARYAVYYSYLSHTPRYYQVVRDGRFAELINVAEVIHREHSDDKTVATNSDEVSILHFLSERVITPFPETTCPKTLKDVGQRADYKANVVRGSAEGHPFIVVDAGEIVKELVEEQEAKDEKRMDENEKSAARKEFIQRLKFHLLDQAGLNLVHEGRRYHVYQRAMQTK